MNPNKTQLCIGDQEPILFTVWQDQCNNVIQPLTDPTIQVYAVLMDPKGNLYTRPGTIVNAAAGTFSYTTSPTDLYVAGTWRITGQVVIPSMPLNRTVVPMRTILVLAA